MRISEKPKRQLQISRQTSITTLTLILLPFTISEKPERQLQISQQTSIAILTPLSLTFWVYILLYHKLSLNSNCEQAEVLAMTFQCLYAYKELCFVCLKQHTRQWHVQRETHETSARGTSARAASQRNRSRGKVFHSERSFSGQFPRTVKEKEDFFPVVSFFYF